MLMLNGMKLAEQSAPPCVLSCLNYVFRPLAIAILAQQQLTMLIDVNVLHLRRSGNSIDVDHGSPWCGVRGENT